jgi:hypothetical protein
MKTSLVLGVTVKLCSLPHLRSCRVRHVVTADCGKLKNAVLWCPTIAQVS